MLMPPGLLGLGPARRDLQGNSGITPGAHLVSLRLQIAVALAAFLVLDVMVENKVPAIFDLALFQNRTA